MLKTAQIDEQMRLVRLQTQKLTASATSLAGVMKRLAPAPGITVYNCNNTTSLPGRLVRSPQTSKDSVIKTIFDTTQSVANFFKTVFGRNSLDDLGMTLQSSGHYDTNHNNAMWDGSRMIYGDGDGKVFIELCKSDDVVAHELMHGVTEFTLQLVYQNESGGLNESLSDVFGSMFKQWRRNQLASAADWLIGADIMGADATSAGYTCLRDMAQPDAPHCLSPQITDYSQYVAGMDPHDSSGIANLAFHRIAMAFGGNSWDKAGQIWYHTVSTTGASPNMTMLQFANAIRSSTRVLYPGDNSTYQTVDSSWISVGL